MCKDCKWECIEVDVEDLDRAIKETEAVMKRKGTGDDDKTS